VYIITLLFLILTRLRQVEEQTSVPTNIRLKQTFKNLRLLHSLLFVLSLFFLIQKIRAAKVFKVYKKLN